MTKIKHLVVWAWLSGVVMAERIATILKEPVTIIDRRDHIWWNCYDYTDKNGIHIHKYWPHIFHTSNKDVWDYLSQFTKWHPFFLKVQAYIDGQNIPFSFNINSIQQCFPENLSKKIIDKLIEKLWFNTRISILDLKKQDDVDLLFLANYIYEKWFLNYYKKQWWVSPEKLDPSVADRVPISISLNNNYFIDKYQWIPINWYTEMFNRMLDNPLISIKLNTEYSKDIDAENVYYTWPIDEYFDYKYWELPYRSLVFDIQEIDTEYFQPNVVISYPNNYDFTRICEHKYFLNEKSPKTTISYEYPCEFVNWKNERYYPIPKSENSELYEKYLREANDIKNLYFFGRLGDYKYYNMDLAIERALELFDKFFND